MSCEKIKEAYMQRKKIKYNIENLILLGCLAVLFISLSLNSFTLFSNTGYIILWVIGSGILTMFVGYTVFSLKIRNQKAEDLWFEMKKQHSENTMRYNFEMESEELLNECERIQDKYNEIYEHINFLISEKREDEISTYLNKIKPYNIYKDMFLSGNHVIDVVINQKIFRARNSGIHLRCDVQVPELKVITDSDLNVLLSNLLDNAIEAVERWSDDPEHDKLKDTIIGFRLRLNNDYLLIREENPCLGITKGKNNQLITSKSNRLMHGIGMQSMRRIVEKYNGTIDYTINGDEFSICIVMEDM